MRKSVALLFFAPALVLADDKPHGLTVTYSAGGKTDTTTSRLAALYVPKGASASPFIPAGAFKAVFRGDIESPLRSDHTFAVEVRGQVKVSINNTPVLDAAGAAAAQYSDKAVQLNKGANAVVIEFASDGEDDAQLRFDWWSNEFPREPVPRTAWSHAPGMATGDTVREGRMLFVTRQCTACHDPGALVAKDGTGMPELLATAPSLADAGARFRPEWLAAWIANPRALRPDATMPHLPLGKEQAADIAAYLASLGKPAAVKTEPEKAPVGGGLFANLACIACHTTPDFAGADAHARIPLAHVKAKFHPAALTEYLKLPATHSPFTRMPDFRLTAAESAALTAYLLGAAKAELPPAKGDPAKGRALAASAGCANCHAIPGIEKSTLAAPTLADAIKSPAKGCLSEKPDKAPDFGLQPVQRAALAAFLATDLASLKRDTSADYAERQIRANNCAACHPHDGRQSVFQKLEAETTALTSAAPPPQHEVEGVTVPPTAIPALTWLGEKLQPGYMSAMIAGAQGFKPRPWLASRMPGFGGPGAGIAAGLAQQHGFPMMDVPEPPAGAALVKTGAKLVSADGGFNCVQCHGVKDQPATAVFEAPGINLAHTIQRIRKSHYHRWLLAPLRVDPETKMPKFSEDGKTTQLSDVLDGKAREQFEAIWQYLRTLQ